MSCNEKQIESSRFKLFGQTCLISDWNLNCYLCFLLKLKLRFITLWFSQDLGIIALSVQYNEFKNNTPGQYNDLKLFDWNHHWCRFCQLKVWNSQISYIICLDSKMMSTIVFQRSFLELMSQSLLQKFLLVKPKI